MSVMKNILSERDTSQETRVTKTELGVDKNEREENETLLMDSDLQSVEIQEDGEVIHGSHSDIRNSENSWRNACTVFIASQSSRVETLWKRFRKPIRRAVGLLMLVLFAAYFVYVCYRDFHAAVPLVVVTAAVTLYKGISLIRKYAISDKLVSSCGQVIKRYHRKTSKYTRWVLYLGVTAALIIFLILDTGRNPQNLRSAGTLAIFILILFLTSKFPTKVKWRPVVCGIGLQLILGLVIVRWSYGYRAFKFLGDQVATFAGFSDKGSIFVFGEKYMDHPVAFKILPCIVFFSCVINILYYLGCIQWMIKVVGGFMRAAMHTSAVESLNAAASIFLGPLETTLMFRPFIATLTPSELNAIMTAGFATVAGTVVAVYIEFGAPPEHVIAATIMSAPAALAIAKLQHPETETPTGDQNIDLGESKDCNIVDAAVQGSLSSVKVVVAVIVNIIGFMGLLTFIDAVLGYLGGLVGFPDLSFEVISSYLFMPLAYMIGIDWTEAGKVGKLIGTKIFFSEFIAYQQLYVMIENNELSHRTISLTTYILTGFGSILSVGMYIGVLISVVPGRKLEFSQTGLRAVIGGNVACFMTAAVCGLLYEGSVFENGYLAMNSTETVNNTLSFST